MPPKRETNRIPFHYYSCMNCNYSKSSRTKAESRLTVKLHGRVCKGKGRNEKLPHYNKEKQFLKGSPKGRIQVTSKKLTGEKKSEGIKKSIEIDIEKRINDLLKNSLLDQLKVRI